MTEGIYCHNIPGYSTPAHYHQFLLITSAHWWISSPRGSLRVKNNKLNLWLYPLPSYCPPDTPCRTILSASHLDCTDWRITMATTRHVRPNVMTLPRFTASSTRTILRSSLPPPWPSLKVRLSRGHSAITQVKNIAYLFLFIYNIISIQCICFHKAYFYILEIICLRFLSMQFIYV